MNVACPHNGENDQLYDFCLFTVLLTEGSVMIKDLFPFVCIEIILSFSRIRYRKKMIRVCRNENRKCHKSMDTTNQLETTRERERERESESEREREITFVSVCLYFTDMISMPSLLSKRSKIYLCNVQNIRHIAMSGNTIWVSDYHLLQQVDEKGKVIREMKDILPGIRNSGIHSVTLSGDLIYIENEWRFIIERKHCVKNLKTDGSRVTLYSTDMELECLYSSHINGDILIVVTEVFNSFHLRIAEIAKVIRCDSTGKKIQEIEFKHQDQTERLYGDPRYITENQTNGDILVSDLGKDALVVLDKSGRHRFDYRGGFSAAEKFRPRAVCTDARGRILLLHRKNGTYRNNENCISLLDQDGNFISRLLEYDLDIGVCDALCVDDANNMYFGLKNVIHVYKLSDSP